MTWRIRARLALAAALVAGPLAVGWFPANTEAAEMPKPRDGEACVQAAVAMEQKYGLPGGLLTAIALAETGRWHRALGSGGPWPWTVRAGAQGRFLDTKDLAVAETLQLQQQGVENIDVGCMQINLLHHPGAFESLDQAFDPMSNAQYAALFLLRLHDRTRSWSRAVALYHSSQESRGIGYWRRVSAIWRDERRDSYIATQNRLRAHFEREKAARAARLGYTATVGPLATPVVRVP